jgi:hypothetical protein
MAIFNGTADQIENNVNKVAEITKANTNETNYPSTAAVVKAISEIDIPEVDLSGKMDKFGEIEKDSMYSYLTLDSGAFVVQKGGEEVAEVNENNIIKVKKEVFFDDIIFADGQIQIPTPSEPYHAANKEYVDNLTIVKKGFFSHFENLICENNTEYEGTEVSSLFLNFPDTDFICSLFFTTAAEGDINITFPESTKFIGAKPTFGNNETWELNIKNGVVVGGKVV